MDFQKEVILNSATLEDGTTRISALEDSDGSAVALRILRCADYYTDKVVDGTVYKTTASAGTLGTITFAVPDVAGLYRVYIKVGLDSAYLSDYSNAWSDFQKTLIAEFEVTGTTAADNKVIMENAINLAIPENYRYLTIGTGTSSTVVLNFTDNRQIAKVAEVQVGELSDYATSDYGDYTYTTYSEATVVACTMEVGTGKWIQENLRFPSYYNVRYNAVGSDETPLATGKYIQYSFQYSVPRTGLSSVTGVGQPLTAITTHTFYALMGDVSSAMDTAIDDLGWSVVLDGELEVEEDSNDE